MWVLSLVACVFDQTGDPDLFNDGGRPPSACRGEVELFYDADGDGYGDDRLGTVPGSRRGTPIAATTAKAPTRCAVGIAWRSGPRRMALTT